MGFVDWPLLTPLSTADRDAVLRAARRRQVRRGEVLFREGDPAEALHLVIRGHFLVQISTEDGDTATLTVAGPGDHLGELALLPDAAEHRRSATVVATADAETLMLSGTAFADLCRQHPGVQQLLIGLLADRVRELSQRLIESMYLGLDQRLYRRLVELVTLFSADSGADAPVDLPLTQEQLAGLVGGTRQSVNQSLQRLADQGIVAIGRGRVTVTDLPALHGKAAR